MKTAALLPLLDVLFLALGAILAQMTEMERVTVLPVELESRVGHAAVLRTGEFVVVSLNTHGLSVDGESLDIDDPRLVTRIRDRDVVARVDRRLPTGSTVQLLAVLRDAGAHVELEVDAP
jgi:biopolymer transport protein ExbD